MAIREGRWDCSNCLKTGIPGREKDCPGCGDPRNPILNPEEKPYLPGDAPEVTDSELLELANAGADWLCGHCGKANRGDVTKCVHCDRGLDEDDSFARRTRYVEGRAAEGVRLDPVDQEERDRVEDLVDDMEEHEQSVGPNPHTPDRDSDLTLPMTALRRSGEIATRVQGYLKERAERLRKRSLPDLRGPAIIVGIVAVVIGMLAGGIWLIWSNFIRTEPVELTVNTLAWERQVEVEEFKTLVEENWSMPSDGRLVRSYRDIHHYDQEFSHYERRPHTVTEQVYVGSRTESYPCGSNTVDLGNGFYDTETVYCDQSVPEYETVTRTEYEDEAIYVDVPVYRTKYVYEVDRWVTDRWVIARGQIGGDDPVPYWPESLHTDENERKGNERKQSYTVILVDEDGKVHSRDIAESIWNELEEDEVLVGQMSRSGDLRGIDWPSTND